MTEITIVVPVLARPANARPLVESILAASSCDWELVFVCSPGDDEQIAACDDLALFENVEVLVAGWGAGPGDYARKIQAGYEVSDAPFVLCGADDLLFHPGWDTAALAVAREFDVGVVGTNDRANPSVIAGQHSTHPLVARTYIDAFGGYVGGDGHVYFDGYDHQFVDSELCATAQARGCYAHCHESVVEHRHPIFNRAVPLDSTYRKGQAEGGKDRALFESRKHLWLSETDQAGWEPIGTELARTP